MFSLSRRTTLSPIEQSETVGVIHRWSTSLRGTRSSCTYPVLLQDLVPLLRNEFPEDAGFWAGVFEPAVLLIDGSVRSGVTFSVAFVQDVPYRPQQHHGGHPPKPPLLADGSSP
jgi:hypothetical protein